MLRHIQKLVNFGEDWCDQRNNRFGILLMLVVALLFAIIDAQARFLTQTIDPLVIAWFRHSGLILIFCVLLISRGYQIFQTHFFWLQILRGLLTAISAALYIYALKFVPLVEVIAVTFVAPLFMSILAAIILGEKMGSARWIIVAVGYLGAIIIIRPGAGILHPAILLVLLEALLFALRQIITRKVSEKDSAACTVAYTAVVGWFILSLPLPWVWTMPASDQAILLLVSTSLLAAIAEVLTIIALSRALAVVVAPIHYSMLIWGTLISWIVFDYLPDIWTVLGAAIIIYSGLSLLFKMQTEHR